MIDRKHLLKVVAAWLTIVYIICFGGVALIPDGRPWFMHYALHMNISMGENVLTLTTFISGLVIWERGWSSGRLAFRISAQQH
jgi:hypothetical protein